MKIESNLRLAIKAAVKSHNTKCDWTTHYHAQKKEILALANRPKNKKRIEAAKATLKKLDAQRTAALKIFKELGINKNIDNIDDSDAFKKAGGIIITKNKERNAELILAEIAQATPAEGAKILKDLGIIWE